MLWIFKDFVNGADLYHFAGIHDSQPINQLGVHRHVVANKDDRRTGLLFDLDNCLQHGTVAVIRC